MKPGVTYPIGAIGGIVLLATVLGLAHILAFRKTAGRERILYICLLIATLAGSLFIPLVYQDGHVGTVLVLEAYKQLAMAELYHIQGRANSIILLVYGITLIQHLACILICRIIARKVYRRAGP